MNTSSQAAERAATPKEKPKAKAKPKRTPTLPPPEDCPFMKMVARRMEAANQKRLAKFVKGSVACSSNDKDLRYPTLKIATVASRMPVRTQAALSSSDSLPIRTRQPVGTQATSSSSGSLPIRNHQAGALPIVIHDSEEESCETVKDSAETSPESPRDPTADHLAAPLAKSNGSGQRLGGAVEHGELAQGNSSGDELMQNIADMNDDELRTMIAELQLGVQVLSPPRMTQRAHGHMDAMICNGCTTRWRVLTQTPAGRAFAGTDHCPRCRTSEAAAGDPCIWDVHKFMDDL
jgi:hypothetical protein